MKLSPLFLTIIWCVTAGFAGIINCSAYSDMANRTFILIHLERPFHRISFQVEVAQTPETRAKGLMGRQTLAKNAGMLFVYSKVKYVEFWMKNTYLSLDIIFIDQDNRVVQLHPYAKPLDLAEIKSFKPVKYVLEVAAGSIQDNNIREGDVLTW